MSASPVFYTTPGVAYAQVTAANTNLDGTGTTVLVVSGATGGVKLDRIRAKAIATSVAGEVRFYLSLDGGTTKRLISELAVTAITVAAGTNSWEGTWYAEGLILPNANAQIYASTHIAATFNLTAETFAP